MNEPHGIDRRSKVYKDIIVKMPKRDDVLEEILDGENFRYLPEPRCRVCTAGDAKKGLTNGLRVKNLVDELLMYPKSISDTYATVEPLMEAWPEKSRITYKSIRTHQMKHLAWDRLAHRMMVERWASQEGLSIIDAAGRMLLTEGAFLEATAQKGWKRLMDGDIEPSWLETATSFKRLDEIKKQAEGEFSTAHLLAQLDVVIAVMKEEIPKERWPRVLAKLRGEEIPMELPATSSTTEDLFSELLDDQVAYTKDEQDE